MAPIIEIVELIGNISVLDLVFPQNSDKSFYRILQKQKSLFSIRYGQLHGLMMPLFLIVNYCLLIADV